MCCAQSHFPLPLYALSESRHEYHAGVCPITALRETRDRIACCTSMEHVRIVDIHFLDASRADGADKVARKRAQGTGGRVRKVVMEGSEEEGRDEQDDEVESQFLAGRHDVKSCVDLVAVVGELCLIADFAG